MKAAFISLSPQGAEVLNRLKPSFADAHLFLHDSVPTGEDGKKFARISDLTREIFAAYDALVFAAPTGVVVRAVSPLVKDKHTDPAVVVVDAAGRFVISLIGGHERGANHLAVRIANVLGAEPVITTTTEALKSVIVGIGCRRGIEAAAIVSAVKEALHRAGLGLDEVRLLASADLKSEEKGLHAAAEELGLPLRFIPSREIQASRRDFRRSPFVEKKVNLPAVAEPAALLAGRRTKLILPKIAIDGITVAIARESFSSLDSVPAGR